MTAYHCSNEDFGAGLIEAAPPDLPTSLGGLTIVVKDSAGLERLAPLYGLNRTQVNYVIPRDTASGLASVTASLNGRAIAEADLEIEAVAPDLFAQFQVVRLRDGVQTIEQGSQIDMGPATDQVYLVMYGTGFRFRSSLANVNAMIDGVDIPVEYAGSQGLPGLDQLNLRLPRSLAGQRNVILDLIVDGRHTSASLYFK